MKNHASVNAHRSDAQVTRCLDFWERPSRTDCGKPPISGKIDLNYAEERMKQVPGMVYDLAEDAKTGG